LLREGNQEIIVLDTSAFIAGFEPLSIKNLQYSVPAVRNELIPNTLPRIRFEAAVEEGKLRIKAPTEEIIRKIRIYSKKSGDLRFLSEADKQVLALALELRNQGHRLRIVTDDYSIQNVANQIRIKFASLTTLGIRYAFHWMLYCPACHYKYPADHRAKRCRICESELKRKPIRKKSL
jgi:UPF0271 protein